MKTQATQSGRDNRGRFTTSNGFGGQRRRTADYRAAFDQAVGPEDLIAVVKAMIDRAKRGNVSAARLICEHCLGKPTVRIELPENEEYRVAGRAPAEHKQEMMQRITDGIAALRKSKTTKSSSKPRRTRSTSKSKPKLPKTKSRAGK